MRSFAFRITAGALYAAAVLGQPPQQQATERLFRFTHVESEQSIEQVAAVVRSVADLPQVSAVVANRTLSARGTPDQIAVAEWLFVELDQPANHATVGNPVKREYRVPGSDEVARIFHLNVTAPQEVQEIATITRSLAEIRRVFVYSPPRALILRGPADRIAMAEWLIAELDQPTREPRSARGSEYRVPGGVDDRARIFYLASTTTPQDLQEVSTILRTIADIRRVFTYTTTKAITLRGTSNELAMAEWLFQELHQPGGRTYSLPRSTDDFTRVLRQTASTTPKELQETATLVRTTAGIGRIVTYYAQRAMVVRGTSQQVATAERLVQERVGPNPAQ